jgi:hypothetical protein
MRNLAGLAVSLLVLCGCGSKSDGVATARSSVPASSVTAVIGPGGSVDIGQTVDAAQKAFPPPKGATIFEQSMSFAILGKQGWGWGSEDGKEAFEVAIDSGKIVAIALTGGAKSEEPDATLKQIGEPTRQATGKRAEMYVWEAADNARFWIHMKGSALVLGNVMMTLIGEKEQLKVMNYRYDDPETFVKQVDLSAEAAGSKDMKKIFEDAKKRALAKAKQNR